MESDRDLTPVADCPDSATTEVGSPPSTGTVSAFGVGATEYRSVAALQKLPDYAEWVPAIQAEIDYAMRKNALTLPPQAEFQAARRRFPGKHEILHLVTPCVIKHDADGKVLRRKFRITAADVCDRPGSTFSSETNSAALDGACVRFLANVTLDRPLKGTRRNLDVKGAYFEGRKLPPEEEGGRSLWAPVPTGWDKFGFQSHAPNGERNWFEITGNVPGLRDAGRVWAADCDAFLLG